MSAYILSIDSLISTFEIIESTKPIKLVLKSNLINKDVYDAMKEEEFILGYFKRPINGVTQIMKVESIDSDYIILKKIIDTSMVFNIDETLNSEEYSCIQTESNIIKISESMFSTIYNGVLDSLNIYPEEENNNTLEYILDGLNEYEIVRGNKFTQKIYFGPPGTGKSYNLSKEILRQQTDLGITKSESSEYDKRFVYRTTIYPEYSYYDFIGNIMPLVNKDGDITYDFKPGVFSLALANALKLSDLNVPVYLVIEEMSRGNIASVFGDVFQLLDRNENGISEYKIDNDIIANYLTKEEIAEYKIVSEKDKSAKKEIYLPHNLNILGTVNTSDQNVFVMDTAFKRRFEFEYVDINPVKKVDAEEYLNEFRFNIEDHKYSWIDFYMVLNKYIVEVLELPEDKQIGQFFIKFDEEENEVSNEENSKQLQNKLLPYLWEDIHLIKMTEKSLFKENYKSFSELYKDFGNKVNIFNNDFIAKLKRIEIEPPSNTKTFIY